MQVFSLQATEEAKFQYLYSLPRVSSISFVLVLVLLFMVLLKTFLNDVNRDLWRGLSDEKKNSFVYLDCLWFTMYKSENPRIRSSVFESIKKKQIFSKKYVFLPIVYWCVDFTYVLYVLEMDSNANVYAYCFLF